MVNSAVSTRSLLVRGKLMRTAEKLYAEYGLASVSAARIGVAAGQRNKSVIQYHFTNSDELIKEIVTGHMAAIEKRRMAMVAALGPAGGISLDERTACLIMPTIEHHVDLGAPSWYARFLAQIFVEPALREFTTQAHLNTPSVRLLNERGAREWRAGEREMILRRSVLLRQLAVHTCAELEYDLAVGRVDVVEAESSWRRLGEDLIATVCGHSPSTL
jgi:AcrR family transcriptional regulator